MNLLLKRQNGAFIDRMTLSDNATLDDLKEEFYNRYHFYPQRQHWNLNSADGPCLKGDKLSDCGVRDDSSLYFKDLGVQISWRLVFFLEYLGPLIIFPLLYYFPFLFYSVAPTKKTHVQEFVYLSKLCYNDCHRVAFFMLMFHFIKREFESLFIHRFSKSTMPIMNLFVNCFHYWILCGIGIGYYLFHPLYMQVSFFNWEYEKIFLVVAFFVFQFLTFMTHLTLRNLRPRGTKIRGVPNNWGFQFVSCANYFWELLVWICFALYTNMVTSYFFVVVVTIVLCQWAKKKHRRYLSEFPGYSKSRKALIPFIL